ncbi:MAG: leucine-rich repeat domain-containing protein [Spirochaetales bacterium]|nr:leucine-rich repeat domain-containing protein [Spirochaetales bacterium]
METKLSEIKKRLNKDFLIKASQKLIQFYKSKDFGSLSQIFSQLYPTINESNPKRIFYKLIKIYHPDSLQTHLLALEASQNNNTYEGLAFYDHMLSIKLSIVKQRPVEYTHQESYEFEQDNYDFFTEEELDEDDFDEDLISIITSIFLGNRNHRLEPVDLAQIDRELILSELNISDLDGLQYCTNVRSLDLSYNSIENIYEIGHLHQLEDLDLSHNAIEEIEDLIKLESLENLYLDDNQIEDISPLLKLPNLKFVSLVGNPLTSMAAIKELQDQGIVVLYY